MTTATTVCPGWCRNTDGSGVHGDEHFAYIAEGFAGADNGRLFAVILRQPQSLGSLGITVEVEMPTGVELLPSQARSLAAGILRAANLAEGLAQ